MSSVINLSSVSTAALPPLNLHGHGHKHGSQVESANDSASSDSSSAQAPSGSTQNLFGTLLQTLEQVIGLQPSSTTPAATASAATPAGVNAAASASATTASAAGVTSATQQQQSTLLQNYLNNLSHKADGSQAPKLAGTSISTNA